MNAPHEAEQERLRRWEQVGNWPLALAAIAFLAAYAWPIIQPELAPGWRDLCDLVVTIVWVIFIVDYVVRLALARPRWRYFWRHLPDLLILALPFLRPLRLIMLLRVLHRRAADSLRGRIVIYVAGGTALLIFCASLAVLDAERGHDGANITSLRDALWWAATTVSTVGYGDNFPVTGVGRAVAVGLMVGGIALLGVVTATLASWLIDRVREEEDEAGAATRADIAVLTAEVRELKAMIAAGHVRAASDSA
jgi:voltage-gated potassium channel